MLFTCSCHPLPELLGEGHQTGTPDGGQTDLLQTPGVQGALEQLEICHVGTGGHREDGPAPPPAFDKSIFAGLSVTRRMGVLRAQSAPFNAPSSLSLSPLSNMNNSSSSLLSRPVMTGLYSSIYHETGTSIKVGSSKSPLKIPTFEI